MTVTHSPAFMPDGSVCGVTDISVIPPNTYYWVKPTGKGSRSWFVMERRVRTQSNKVDIVDDAGGYHTAEIHGIKSGNLKKAKVRLYSSVTSQPIDYLPGQIVEPLGVTADYLISIGLLGEMELEGFNRPMANIDAAGRKYVKELNELQDQIRQAELEYSNATAKIERATNDALERLTSIREEIADEEKTLAAVRGDLAAALQYPSVPREPKLTIAQVRRNYSGKSGIYFAWDEQTDKPVYVGRSKNVGERVADSRPELNGTLLTVLPLPEPETRVAELHYISLLRPGRNGECRTCDGGGE